MIAQDSSNLRQTLQNSADQKKKKNQNFKIPEEIQKSYPWRSIKHVCCVTSILKFPLEAFKSGAQ